VPELPEVETITRALAPRITGRRILSAEFRCLRILRGGDPEKMSAAVAGKRILGVHRAGKFILMPLQGGQYLTVHLGMTGKLLVGGTPAKHTHAIFTLDRGGVLLYDDQRQFGRIQLTDAIPARVEKLGPEPLEVAFEEFFRRTRGRKTRIKALLLNQDFLRGIGNIYADEALFRARIHPQAIAGRLRQERLRRLHKAIVGVLAEAIEGGGSSISDYVDPDGRKGWFQLQHRVYQRTGEPCTVCAAPIRRVLVAQRSSHYCPRCQRV
jgi:formamidopyrimidine-DNA glycosylase